ncbi:MAG: flavin reductase family protein [Bacteroidales bacterium]|nr:flavin reductase family protein [Bacteroidales bacterium]
MNDKLQWEPGTLVYPLPAVMVSCGHDPAEYNIITIAWTGTICTQPAMCYISVRPERHSYQLIKETGEYVINLTTQELARATDWCGVKSGKNFDKFKEMNLTARRGSIVKAPIIVESPVNIECKVLEIKELGVHHMFISEVVHIQVSEKYMNPETGKFELAGARPISYLHGTYYELGNRIGKFGFSVEKKRRKRNNKTSK